MNFKLIFSYTFDTQIDFASRDCQTLFFENMERTGQLRPGERPDERRGRFPPGQGSYFERTGQFREDR